MEKRCTQNIIAGTIQAISQRNLGIKIYGLWYDCPKEILKTLKKFQEITFVTEGKKLIKLLPNEVKFLRSVDLEEKKFIIIPDLDTKLKNTFDIWEKCFNKVMEVTEKKNKVFVDVNKVLFDVNFIGQQTSTLFIEACKEMKR